MQFEAFSEAELLETFHGASMSAKHVLIWYSFIVGLNAKVIVDMGLGNSTRAARAASRVTRGVVYSCDSDKDRFGKYESEGAPNWKFYCLPSSEFIDVLPEPIDVVFHDASHVHEIVRGDLLSLFPKMRRYGLICVHDTQQPRYTLLEAVTEAVEMASPTQTISSLTLPFGCGLTVLRVETSRHDEIVPAGKFRGDREVTVPRTLLAKG